MHANYLLAVDEYDFASSVHYVDKSVVIVNVVRVR